MEAAHMTFQEEVIKSRSELRHLRLENARLKRSNKILHTKVLRLENENYELKQENRLLKKEQSLLREIVNKQEKQIESLNLIVDELRRMVFGNKKISGDGNRDESGGSTSAIGGETKERKKADRAKDSYRRPAPADEEITATIQRPLSHCQIVELF